MGDRGSIGESLENGARSGAGGVRCFAPKWALRVRMWTSPYTVLAPDAYFSGIALVLCRYDNGMALALRLRRASAILVQREYIADASITAIPPWFRCSPTAEPVQHNLNLSAAPTQSGGSDVLEHQCNASVVHADQCSTNVLHMSCPCCTNHCVSTNGNANALPMQYQC